MSGEFAGAPDWVKRGCSAFFGDDSPAKICGVGIAGGSRNLGVLKTTAEGRGRIEISRSLELKVKAMLADYYARTTGRAEFGETPESEQQVAFVSKQLAQIDLVGVEQRDMWISNSNTMYVLMAYDAATYRAAVSRMANISEGVRRAVIERTDSAFLELDEETNRKARERALSSLQEHGVATTEGH